MRNSVMNADGQGVGEASTESCVAMNIPGKTYHSPTLADYGSVRDLTLGGSPGSTDSGDPLNEDQPVEP